MSRWPEKLVVWWQGISRSTRASKSLGERGEDEAAKFLRKLGYVIVERRARSKFSEIDIIAVDGRTVVFVEVKTRSSHDAGHPADAITPDKQRRLTRAAHAYLKRHDLLECRCRFDVLAITWPVNAKRPVIEHYLNAFEAQGDEQFSP